MFEQIKKVLISTTNVDASKVIETSRLKEDLGIDSLDSVELILELETQFDIRIEDEELNTLLTVKDIINLIELKTK